MIQSTQQTDKDDRTDLVIHSPPVEDTHTKNRKIKKMFARHF